MTGRNENQFSPLSDPRTAPGDDERVTAELLQQVRGSEEELSFQAWRRIDEKMAQAINAKSFRSVRTQLAWFFAGAAITAALAFALRTTDLPHSAPQPSRPLAITGQPWIGRVGVTLFGRAQFQAQSESDYTLTRGMVEFETHEGSADVTTPHGKVALKPRSRIVIRVTSLKTEVANFAGTAATTWHGAARTFVLASNQATRSDTQRLSAVPPLQMLLDQAEDNEMVTQLDQSHIEPHADRLVQKKSAASSSAPVEESHLADRLAQAESAILRAGLDLLHTGDTEGALAEVRRYRLAYPNGDLNEEATMLELQALMQSGQKSEALAELDHLDIDQMSKAAALHIYRGELRLAEKRYADALGDFDRSLALNSSAHNEAALFGRAVCLSHLGKIDEARQSILDYAKRYPTGRHIDQVKRNLQQFTK